MRRKEQLLQENSKYGILIIVAFLMLKVLLHLTNTSRNELFIETKTTDCLDIPARAKDMDYHTCWTCEKWFIHQKDH
jgi:hypothetical protein